MTNDFVSILKYEDQILMTQKFINTATLRNRGFGSNPSMTSEHDNHTPVAGYRDQGYFCMDTERVSYFVAVLEILVYLLINLEL